MPVTKHPSDTFSRNAPEIRIELTSDTRLLVVTPYTVKQVTTKYMMLGRRGSEAMTLSPEMILQQLPKLSLFAMPRPSYTLTKVKRQAYRVLEVLPSIEPSFPAKSSILAKQWKSGATSLYWLPDNFDVECTKPCTWFTLMRS